MDALNYSVARLEASLIRLDTVLKDLIAAQRRTLAALWYVGIGIVIALNGAIAVGILNLLIYLER